ncbi:MAG: amino acid ABC transporter permease [Ruminococcaceae bacterium]|nr:amino acid ABC transporter permease [Oscillospiraceae bacterium]
MNFSSAFFNSSIPLLNEGIKLTVTISVFSLIFGMLIGFISCIMSISKIRILKFISGTYIWIIRGTPMLVQALIIHLAMPQFIQTFNPAFRIEPYTSGLITLSLNAGAYLSEIFRGGITAVPKGQSEAARSLGMSKTKTMLRVILPQAIKISIPSMVNQFIITIKDTSILSVIGLAEIANRAKQYVGSTYNYFATYVLVAIYYLVVISILMVVSRWLEKKLSYEHKDRS